MLIQVVTFWAIIETKLKIFLPKTKIIFLFYWLKPENKVNYKQNTCHISDNKSKYEQLSLLTVSFQTLHTK